MKSHETKAKINRIKHQLTMQLMKESDARIKAIRDIEKGDFNTSPFLSDDQNEWIVKLNKLQQSINAPHPSELTSS